MAAGMSVWESRSGRLHWLRRCSGGGGVRKVRRITVSRERYAQARAAGTGPDGIVCPCLWRVEFAPGKRARN